MQSLINRVLHNVKFVYENVVIKYIEDDLVFSLHVKNVTLCSVDGDWEQAFVGELFQLSITTLRSRQFLLLNSANTFPPTLSLIQNC